MAFLSGGFAQVCSGVWRVHLIILPVQGSLISFLPKFSSLSALSLPMPNTATHQFFPEPRIEAEIYGSPSITVTTGSLTPRILYFMTTFFFINGTF